MCRIYLNQFLRNKKEIKMKYRKTCIFTQVMFPNMMTYLDRTFKREQNDINFKMILLNWCQF